MATYTPPPYFPQSSLSPPDPNRYRKFKLVIAVIIIAAIAAVGGVVTAAWYFIAR
jgi:hypothetical protein